jgi:hypothetical protein
MSKMILLHLAHVSGKFSVVQAEDCCQSTFHGREARPITHSACNHKERLEKYIKLGLLVESVNKYRKRKRLQ